MSDLSLADFWGIHNLYPDMYDNKGASMILAYSEKGYELINNCGVRKKECNYKIVLEMNPAIYKCSTAHPKRAMFFESMGDDDSFSKKAKVALHKPLTIVLKYKLIKFAYESYCNIRKDMYYLKKNLKK